MTNASEIFDEIRILADNPAKITDPGVCLDVLASLDKAAASIEAQLDVLDLRAQSRDLSPKDEDRFKRASSALYLVNMKRKRIAKRLKALQPWDNPPAAPEHGMRSAEIRRQTHLESLRLNLEARERKQAAAQARHQAEQKDREKLFIAVARKRLPREIWLEIWHEVDVAQGAEERPMTGFLAGLTSEQCEQALSYRGPENHGDPDYLKRAPTIEARRDETR